MNNIINRFFLWLVLRPSGLYSRMGIHVPHLEAILTTKLMMDDRRPNTMQQTRRDKKKPVKLATVFTFFMAAVLGSFFLVAFSVGNSITVQLCFYYSMYIFLLASSLISDFTSVLIDVRDNYIILPKPVNDKTVVAARLLHILIHISKLVVPMTLPGVIYMAVTTTILGTLAFFLLVLLATLLTLFLINALYIFILKVTTPQKFQNILSTFQIVFAIGMYASYQLLPRMINKNHFEHYHFSADGRWYVWLAPPYWFAKGWRLLGGGSFSYETLAAALLALAMPIISIYLVITYFAPAFNQKLALISNSSTDGDQKITLTTTQQNTATKKQLIDRIANAICKPGAEAMAFLLSWKLTSRSRDFKMKVYPSIGYMIVIAFVSFYQSGRGLAAIADNKEKLPFIFIGAIYFSSFLMLIAIGQLTFSDKYKASWIYYSAPIATPGVLTLGAVKSIIVKFYLPVVAVTSTAGLLILGPGILPNLVLGLFNELFIIAMVVYLTMRSLPFSMQQSNNTKGGSIIRAIFSLSIFAAVAALHFFIYKITAVVYIFAAMSIALVWLLQGTIRNISWQKIRVESEG